MIGSAVCYMQEKNLSCLEEQRLLCISAGTNVFLVILLLAVRFCSTWRGQIICILLWEGEVPFSLSDFANFKSRCSTAAVNSSCCNITLLKYGKNVIWASYL